MFQMMSAWKEAYACLADVLIKREAELYEERRNAKGCFRPYAETCL